MQSHLIQLVTSYTPAKSPQKPREIGTNTVSLQLLCAGDYAKSIPCASLRHSSEMQAWSRPTRVQILTHLTMRQMRDLLYTPDSPSVKSW